MKKYISLEEIKKIFSDPNMLQKTIDMWTKSEEGDQNS